MADEDEELLCMWMEGDSLAPPCQAEDDVITAILELAEVQPHDVRAKHTLCDAAMAV
jgi:hypothetical protein